MELKRIYDHSSGTPVLSGVKVLHAGPKQKFSNEVIARGVAEGWLEMKEGKIFVMGQNKTVVYKIVRIPGHYCSHCKSSLESEAHAKKHVAEVHSSEQSPDPENPSGYMKTNAYKGVKVEA